MRPWVTRVFIVAAVLLGVAVIAIAVINRPTQLEADITPSTTTTATAVVAPTTSVPATTVPVASVEVTTTTTVATVEPVLTDEPPPPDPPPPDPPPADSATTSAATVPAATAVTTTAAPTPPPPQDPTTTTTTTTVPEAVEVELGAGCRGSFRENYMVRDGCVLRPVEQALRMVFEGTKAQRMAAIRDGHTLGGLFDEWEAHFTELGGTDQHIWAYPGIRPTVEFYGADWETPIAVTARFRLHHGVHTSNWWGMMVTTVDDHWQMAYMSFCRYIVAGNHNSPPCPPDPRPEVHPLTTENIVPAYDAVDDPNRFNLEPHIRM